jgi:hypothetical protein
VNQISQIPPGKIWPLAQQGSRRGPDIGKTLECPCQFWFVSCAHHVDNLAIIASVSLSALP